MTARRRAACCCGQLSVTCEGEPVRVSVCHCLECQRRTGSIFGAQARFRPEQIVAVEGRAAEFVRVGDEGNRITFRFCPVCASTLYWDLSGVPDLVAVAVGAFADPQFPRPTRSVYEARRHSWAPALDWEGVEHL
jgi:hypothetical protein